LTRIRAGKELEIQDAARSGRRAKVRREEKTASSLEMFNERCGGTGTGGFREARIQLLHESVWLQEMSG
jgi:hypothetical protein